MNAIKGLAIHTKERMYTVDSGASLHMVGLFSLNMRKKTFRQSSTILDIQTANGILVSNTQAKVCIKDKSREDHAMNWVILFRGCQEKLPDYQKVRKLSNAASKTSSQ